MYARIDGGQVKPLTRTGLDWSHQYKRTIEALRSLKVKSAYLDGELCALNGDGVPVFSRLQAAINEVLGEAGALIRRLLEDRGVEVPHLVIAVTWNGRSSCAATSVRMPCGPRRGPDQLCLCLGLTWR